MIRHPYDKKDIPAETVVNTIWVSSFLAMIFTLPPLGIFLGIYYGTGNILMGAVLGFGVHFIMLATSGRISEFLVKLMN